MGTQKKLTEESLKPSGEMVAREQITSIKSYEDVMDLLIESKIDMKEAVKRLIKKLPAGVEYKEEDIKTVVENSLKEAIRREKDIAVMTELKDKVKDFFNNEIINLDIDVNTLKHAVPEMFKMLVVIYEERSIIKREARRLEQQLSETAIKDLELE